ncbi:hypothetical protein Spith_1693 [Spirochaeta thermophila DSM 6578]|uniref:Uncharacterized protein n=2 Tax=Winmispira thermophila TaxID=154 RepID=G0GBE4_WINT7|nr:hypothetical protein Spith_1693 [Spirochaeta thermophila DSM 6578]
MSEHLDPSIYDLEAEELDSYRREEVFPSPPEGERKYWRLIREAGTSPSQSIPFLSAVQLDQIRRPADRVGLERLFLAYLTHGGPTWLNPYPLLQRLERSLEKYLGPKKALAPLVDLLARLAEKGISPHGFLLYVVLPRMEGDFNWREWEDHHFPAFRTIGDLLVSLRQEAPFDKPVLGDEHLHLARDVVLIKYLARPLARLPRAELQRDDLILEYQSVWRSLHLASTTFIHFLRTHILGPLYTLSGKLSLDQIIELLAPLPELEPLLASLPPEKGLSVHLYHALPEREILKRTTKDYLPSHVIRELSAYTRLVARLLPRPLGIPVLRLIAYLLRMRMEPDLGRTILSLVESLPPKGGLVLYKWHLKRLFSIPVNRREAFIAETAGHQGVHPAYPFTEDLFPDPEETHQRHAFAEYAKLLSVEPDRIKGASDIVHLYLRRHPELEPVFSLIREDILEGRDRRWDPERISLYDKATGPIHAPFLRTIIPGMGSLFYTAPKSPSFQDLASRYPVSPTLPPLSHTFPLTLTTSTPQLWEEASVKERIALQPLLAVSAVFRTPLASPPEQEVFRAISRKLLSLREPLERTYQELAAAPSPSPEAAHLRQRYEHLLARQRALRTALGLYQEASPHLRFLIALMVGAHFGKSDPELSRLALSWTLARYRHDPLLAKQIAYLSEDLAEDDLSLAQLSQITLSLEHLFRLVADDPHIRDALDHTSTEQQDVLAPFLLTRRKTLTLDAVDAALKRLCRYHQMLAEQAKWQELLSRTYRQEEPPHTFKLYLSKTPLDAYYGDMGGICLSEHPEAITNPDLYVARLADLTSGTIQGVAVLYRNTVPSQSMGGRPYWFAFAINPLPSLCRKLSNAQLLQMYLNYRILFEELSRRTGMPVLLPGISSWGIISNNDHLRRIILRYELMRKPPVLKDATGFSFYYHEYQYAHAACIIDPARPDSFTARRDLEALTAHLASDSATAPAPSAPVSA